MWVHVFVSLVPKHISLTLFSLFLFRFISFSSVTSEQLKMQSVPFCSPPFVSCSPLSAPLWNYHLLNFVRSFVHHFLDCVSSFFPYVKRTSKNFFYLLECSIFRLSPYSHLKKRVEHNAWFLNWMIGSRIHWYEDEPLIYKSLLAISFLLKISLFA